MVFDSCFFSAWVYLRTEDWFYVPLHATCLYVKLNENVSEDEIYNMEALPLAIAILLTFCWLNTPLKTNMSP